MVRYKSLDSDVFFGSNYTLVLQFSLISGFYHWLTTRDVVKILIIGPTRSGKTTLLEQIRRLLIPNRRPLSFESIAPTIGMNHAKIVMRNVQVTLWDVGGSMQSIWHEYLSEADAVVFVIDAADTEIFPKVADILKDVRKTVDQRSLPLLVIANKTDLPSACKKIDIQEKVLAPAGVFENEGSDESSSRNPSANRMSIATTRAVEICSLQSVGVRENFEWIVEQARIRAKLDTQ